MIGTSLLLVVTLLILFLVWVCRKLKVNLKCYERIQSIKSKIFYNSIIRYFFLGSLKLNLNAMTALKFYSASETGERITAIAILLMINLVPLILSRILYKKAKVLESAENLTKFSTMYSGKNVNENKSHKVWIYPLAFFFRRTIFICATVFLSEVP